MAKQKISKIVGCTMKQFTTNDGRTMIHRITTVLRPNGKYRYPEDYFEIGRGAVKITAEERERYRIPSYQELHP